MQLLLDTCTQLWLIIEPDKLSKKASVLLTDEDSEIYVSCITCLEIATLYRRNIIELGEHWKPWYRRFVRKYQWNMLDISWSVIEEAYSLPETFHADPADRILVATSRTMNIPLITSDRKILNYPHVDAIWN